MSESNPPARHPPKPSPPKVGFYAYIDESGDEGFRCRQGEFGQWFILAAAIIKAQNNLETRDVVDRTKERLSRPGVLCFHFKDMDHGPRLVYVDEISKTSTTLSLMCFHKPSLDKTRFCGDGLEKNQLYRYASRYLLERISWYGRENRPSGSDEKVRVIFSKRKQMSYETLVDYIGLLRSGGSMIERNDIDWSAVSPDLIEAKAHDQMHGLQIADAAAGSAWRALQASKLGFTEPRYISMLSERLYRRKGKLSGYGIKVFPAEAEPLAKGLLEAVAK